MAMASMATGSSQPPTRLRPPSNPGMLNSRLSRPGLLHFGMRERFSTILAAAKNEGRRRSQREILRDQLKKNVEEQRTTTRGKNWKPRPGNREEYDDHLRQWMSQVEPCLYERSEAWKEMIQTLPLERYPPPSYFPPKYLRNITAFILFFIKLQAYAASFTIGRRLHSAWAYRRMARLGLPPQEAYKMSLMYQISQAIQVCSGYAAQQTARLRPQLEALWLEILRRFGRAA